MTTKKKQKETKAAKYIAYDTETSGLGAGTKVLSAYFEVLDENFNFVDSLNLKLKPDNISEMVVEKAALKLNKINLEEHLGLAETYSEAWNRALFSFLRKYKPEKEQLISVGHNFDFDLQRLSETFPEFKSFVSRRGIDTSKNHVFLVSAKKMHSLFSISLSEIATQFGFRNAKDIAHDPRADVKLTLFVLKKQFEIIGNQSFSFIPEEKEENR